MVGGSVLQIFPSKGAVFQGHIGPLGAALGNGDGAGIEHQNSFVLLPNGDVGMAVNQDISLL